MDMMDPSDLLPAANAWLDDSEREEYSELIRRLS